MTQQLSGFRHSDGVLTMTTDAGLLREGVHEARNTPNMQVYCCLHAIACDLADDLQ
jgi:hypothetical protein